MKIAAVETRRYRFPFDPPLRAAWDPEPRAAQDATLVVVRSDDGIEGYASGDALPDEELLRDRLVGLDPRRTEVVREICETVDFHGGRPWTVEVAVWDLVGRALGVPCWQLLGGRSERILAYASSAERVAPEERVARCLRLRDAGLRAVKIRLDAAGWRDDLETVAAVREAAGPSLELMVDANQGWRMPGDRTPRWDVATAAACARELEALGVYWLEEPLRTDDYDGYRALRRRTSLRIAAGEMTREAQQARDLLLRGEIDVLQCDCVLAGGIGGARGSRGSRICWGGHGRPTRGRMATECSPTSTSRSRSRLRRSSRCRSTRPRSTHVGATGCCRRRSRWPPTGRSPRRRARVSASFPTSTPSRPTEPHDVRPAPARLARSVSRGAT